MVGNLSTGPFFFLRYTSTCAGLEFIRGCPVDSSGQNQNVMLYHLTTGRSHEAHSVRCPVCSSCGLGGFGVRRLAAGMPAWHSRVTRVVADRLPWWGAKEGPQLLPWAVNGSICEVGAGDMKEGSGSTSVPFLSSPICAFAPRITRRLSSGSPRVGLSSSRSICCPLVSHSSLPIVLLRLTNFLEPSIPFSSSVVPAPNQLFSAKTNLVMVSATYEACVARHSCCDPEAT